MILKKMIRNDIDSESVYFKTEKIYHYENQEYTDRDIIANKCLGKNPIIAERTTSNPSKIIKDYEYQQLDEKRVYGADQADYVKVYKNALGKVVLPTCTTSTPGQKGCVVSDKTAEQRALDSYVNGGLIRPKYTYSFGGTQNWYDSPTEAENAFKNSEFTIKKSLFYYYDGQYFNAFNRDDLKVLKKTKLNAGYYFKGSDNDVDTKQDIKTFWDTNSNFEGRLKQGLSKIFNANIESLVKYDPDIIINIKPDSKEWISGFWSSKEKGEGSIRFDTETNQLIIDHALRKDGLDITQLVNDLHDASSSKWKADMIHVSCGLWASCDDYNRHIYSDKINGVSFGFQLDTTGNGNVDGWNETHPAKIETSLAEEKMSNNIFFKTDDVNPLLRKMMDSSLFVKPNWNVKKIAESIDLYSEGKADEIAISTYRKMDPSNWDQRFKDKMFEIYYEKLKSVLFKFDSNDDKFEDKDDKFDFDAKDNSSPVHKDWMYGSKAYPAQFSYHQSRKYYEKKILKDEIISKTGKDDEQITWTKSSAGDFTTSWKNWKDNFYYLEQGSEIKQIPLKQMYYVDTIKNRDISKFSDLIGETVASSTVKAQNIAFMSSEKILRKQYFIYDINGQVSISASDEQSAVAKLKNKVNLNYTYMNINEAKQIIDQDLNWKDIISDGLYTVYKFKSSVGSWLYFMSFDSAYKQFQNQVGLITGISQETKIYYRYTFKYNNQRYVFDWSTDQQIDEIVKKIYKIIKQ